MADISKYQVKTKHDPDFVRRVSKDGALASRIMKDDKTLYKELQADMVALKIIDPPVRDQNIARYGEKEFVLSPEQITARIKHTQQELHDFFAGEHSDPRTAPGEVAKSDPVRYAEMQLANQPPALVPKRNDPGLFTIGEKLSSAANLPASLRVSADEFGRICREVAIAEEAKKAVKS